VSTDKKVGGECDRSICDDPDLGLLLRELNRAVEELGQCGRSETFIYVLVA
jgi:hypothetical protein